MKLVAATRAACGVCLVISLSACPDKSRNESIKLSNEGNKALGQKQFETAVERYEKAIERWGENTTAWYGLASAQIGKKDWKNAADAMEKAVQIGPDVAMYQMVYGYTLYEKAVFQAREDEARKQNKKPEQVQVDFASVNFEKSMQHLQQAVKLNPELWRAHYYIGRIYRDTGKAKEGAENLSKALLSAPAEYGPWVALSELYRGWDYTDQAIAVAEQGVAVVPQGAENYGEIYYSLGMGYQDKRLDEKAIEAFSKAVDIKRDLHKAKFQRGQVYFRKGDHANAKRDLEEFGKSGGSSLEFEKQMANKMLMDIASKSAQSAAPTEKPSPEDLVKKNKKG
ncbi:MAG: tetratricopeptide repeat protein [Kofleriaceae bacterium]